MGVPTAQSSLISALARNQSSEMGGGAGRGFNAPTPNAAGGVAMPRIFEGGVQTGGPGSDIADPAAMEIRRMQDDSLQQHAAQQQLQQQLARIPNIPGIGEFERQRLRNSIIAQHVRSQGALADTQNRTQGVASNQDFAQLQNSGTASRGVGVDEQRLLHTVNMANAAASPELRREQFVQQMMLAGRTFEQAQQAANDIHRNGGFGRANNPFPTPGFPTSSGASGMMPGGQTGPPAPAIFNNPGQQTAGGAGGNGQQPILPGDQSWSPIRTQLQTAATGATGVGEFLDRLNASSPPGFVRQNLDAIRQWVAQNPALGGIGAWDEAARGVNTRFGLTTTPWRANLATGGAIGGGVGGAANMGRLAAGASATGGIAGRMTPWGTIASTALSLPVIGDYLGSLWRGGELTPEQSGRAALANLLQESQGR